MAGRMRGLLAGALAALGGVLGRTGLSLAQEFERFKEVAKVRLQLPDLGHAVPSAKSRRKAKKSRASSRRPKYKGRLHARHGRRVTGGRYQAGRGTGSRGRA